MESLRLVPSNQLTDPIHPEFGGVSILILPELKHRKPHGIADLAIIGSVPRPIL